MTRVLCGEGNDGGGGGEAGGDGGEGDSGARRSEFMEKPAESRELSPHSTQIINLTTKSSQVKSSQSSQVKFKFQWRPRPPPLGRPPSREIGRARRGATGTMLDSRIDSPEPGLYPRRLLLDHRGAPGHHLRAFFRKSTVWLCKPDPGRRRERSGRRGGARTCTARRVRDAWWFDPGVRYCPILPFGV